MAEQFTALYKQLWLMAVGIVGLTVTLVKTHSVGSAQRSPLSTCWVWTVWGAKVWVRTFRTAWGSVLAARKNIHRHIPVFGKGMKGRVGHGQQKHAGHTLSAVGKAVAELVEHAENRPHQARRERCAPALLRLAAARESMPYRSASRWVPILDMVVIRSVSCLSLMPRVCRA